MDELKKVIREYMISQADSQLTLEDLEKVPTKLAEIWNTTAIDATEDPGSFWKFLDSTIGKGSRAYRDWVSDQPINQQSIAPKLAGQMMGILTDPLEKHVGGEDVSVGDLALAGLSTAPYAGPVARAGTAVAKPVLGSGVMSGAKVLQKARPESQIVNPVAEWVGPHRLNVGEWARRQIINRRTEGPAGSPTLKGRGLQDWYSHPFAKIGHVWDMAKSAVKHRKDRAIIPQYVKDEMAQLEKAGIIDKTMADLWQANPAYVQSIMEKFLPRDPRTLKLRSILGDSIFPREAYTTIREISRDGSVIKNLLDDVTDMPPEMFSTHVSPHIARELKLGGHNVHISTKPIHIDSPVVFKINSDGYYVGAKGSPKLFNLESANYFTAGPNQGTKSFRTRGVFAWRGKLPVVNEVKNLVEGGMKSKDEIISSLMSKNKDLIKSFNKATKEWKSRKPDIPGGRSSAYEYAMWRASRPKKRLYNRKDLEKNIFDDGQNISVSQHVLTTDTLLATMPVRMIINKRNPLEGGYVYWDQMRQGLGKKWADWILDIGSDTNRLFIDIQPFTTATKFAVAGGARRQVQKGFVEEAAQAGAGVTTRKRVSATAVDRGRYPGHQVVEGTRRVDPKSKKGVEQVQVEEHILPPDPRWELLKRKIHLPPMYRLRQQGVI